MNTILFLDKQLYFLKLYHKSNFLLIPGIPFLFFHEKMNIENPFLHLSLNLTNYANLTYHSYFSLSAVLTDYVKPRKFTYLLRTSNLLLHCSSFAGYMLLSYNKLNK